MSQKFSKICKILNKSLKIIKLKLKTLTLQKKRSFFCKVSVFNFTKFFGFLFFISVFLFQFLSQVLVGFNLFGKPDIFFLFFNIN